MSLITRKPNTPKPAPEPEPEIDELCVRLKEAIATKLVSGMASYQIEELRYEMNVGIDAIDAAARTLRPKETPNA